MRLSQSDEQIMPLRSVGCSHIHMWDAPSYEWWVPISGREDWYFWTPRAGSHPGSLELDYTTADEDMQELLPVLHRAGIATMPSCTGHRPVRDNIMPRLDAIDRCADLIRGNGLLFENVETGRLGFYANRSWVPPNKAELAQNALRESMVGYLGMVDQRRTGRLEQVHRHLRRHSHCGPSLMTDRRGDVLDFTVICPSWEEQVDFWRRLTDFCSEHLG